MVLPNRAPKPFYCLACGQEHTHTTIANDFTMDLPKTGDISLCERCGVFGLFEVAEDGVISLRAPSESEQKDLENDPDLKRVRAAWLQSKIEAS